MRMTFIDFFAGIGGFHSGFEKTGMKCVGWCELFFEIMRLIDEAEENNPRWIIAENVKNLLSIEGGGGDSSQCCLKWQREGTVLNGECTTQKITEYLKTESECILLDILEKQVDENYYLKPEKVKELLSRL